MWSVMIDTENVPEPTDDDHDEYHSFIKTNEYMRHLWRPWITMLAHEKCYAEVHAKLSQEIERISPRPNITDEEKRELNGIIMDHFTEMRAKYINKICSIEEFNKANPTVDHIFITAAKTELQRYVASNEPEGEPYTFANIIHHMVSNFARKVDVCAVIERYYQDFIAFQRRFEIEISKEIAKIIAVYLKETHGIGIPAESDKENTKKRKSMEPTDGNEDECRD
jgi:hypothetical protein